MYRAKFCSPNWGSRQKIISHLTGGKISKEESSEISFGG
jgi:hypothetical protein